MQDFSDDGLAEAEAALTQLDNSPIGRDCPTCPDRNVAVYFDPNGSSIDAEVEDYRDAIILPSSNIPGSDKVDTGGIVDAFQRKYGDQLLAQLFAVLTPEGFGGGLGYRILSRSHIIHRYDVDFENKIIALDDDQFWSNFTNDEAADALHEALEDIAAHIAYQNETFWQAFGRIALGTGLVILGAGETAIGVVGIVTPEPATTGAGIVLAGVGIATLGEGATMVLGLNSGAGYNFLAEGFAAIGTLVGGNTGEDLARNAFIVANIVVSLGGTVRVLRVPNQQFIMQGHLHGQSARLANAVGDGFTVGRLQLMYRLRSGRVYVNVTNNSNQWFIRLQNVDGVRVLNGRIINGQNWHRVDNASEALKVLVKLAMANF
ncbi:hypothetical protein KDD17_10270 [Sulfitobacter albidus]|uniref:Uncharacterized protein n=1 Tax=Sulfitobacter albidus TaxID=2829501 RepID=A0A975JBM7_9RHOB|nr:hypothetical protein [Sulfitobacter albidus]QUJ75372.1 hypothetical protein KDD17_10270 [Sulfitobacter albidus]